MMLSTTSLLAALLAVAPLSTNSHMFLASPIPFGPGAGPQGPMPVDGSKWPCNSADWTSTTMNSWSAGETQKLVWSGTAVHNGGSCQISVTTDKKPNANSKFKVIHSIEGGCPNPPAEGGNYAGGAKPALFHEFKVPSELPNGELVAQITWFNKVGVREMYAYCAPITVSGGSDDASGLDALPDVAIANIAQAPNGCTTKEGNDYVFANPGKSVVRQGNGPFMPLCGGDNVSGDISPAPGSPQASAPRASSAPAVAPSQPPANGGASTPAQAALSGQVASTVRQVVTVTAPSGPGPTSQKAAQSPTDSQPAGSASVASKPVAQSSAAPPSPLAPSNSSSQACSPDGSIICSADGKQFAICNWGKALFQAVAAGTKCEGGKIAKRDNYHSGFVTVYA